MCLRVKNFGLYLVLILCLVALGFSSCEEKLNIDVADAKKCLVMSAYMTPKEAFSLCLTESMSYSDVYTADRIANASVSVFSDGALIEDLSYDAAKRMYVGIKYPVIGMKYSVEVHYDDLPDLSAVTLLPESPVISDIEVSSAEDVSLSFVIHDAKDVSNFYRLLVKEIWPSGAIKFPAIRSVDQMLRNKGEGDAAFSIDSDPKNLYSIFADKMFEGGEYSIKISFRHSDYSKIKPKLVLVVQAITEDYYLFLKTYAAQRTTDYIPFSKPVRLHTNVMGGLGILAAFSDAQLPIL